MGAHGHAHATHACIQQLPPPPPPVGTRSHHAPPRTTTQVTALTSLGLAARRYSTDAAVLLEAVRQLAGPVTGLSVVDSASLVVNSLKIIQTLEKIREQLQARQKEPSAQCFFLGFLRCAALHATCCGRTCQPPRTRTSADALPTGCTACAFAHLQGLVPGSSLDSLANLSAYVTLQVSGRAAPGNARARLLQAPRCCARATCTRLSRARTPIEVLLLMLRCCSSRARGCQRAEEVYGFVPAKYGLSEAAAADIAGVFSRCAWQSRTSLAPRLRRVHVRLLCLCAPPTACHAAAGAQV